MKYYIIVAVILLIGYFWVRRLADLIYNNEKYTKGLDRKFNYDQVLPENEKKETEE